jgi:predicted nucleic-acid-binding Zn-ribbon protein
MSPFSGYTSDEVCSILRRPRQILSRAGILDRLKKTYPFNNKTPLYDLQQVNTLTKDFVRQDGMIALGQLPRLTPLIKALDGYSAEQDSTCPQCGSMSIVEKPITKDDHSGAHKMWCPKCGIINNLEGGISQADYRKD